MSVTSTFRVTFHVSHPTIDASEVERIFSFPIRYSRSVGNPKKTKRGTLLEGFYEETNVSFALHEEPLSFDDASIDELVMNSIRSFDASYLHKIQESRGSCYFLVGVFSSGNVMFDFGVDVVQVLASLKIGIWFDFYGGED